MTNTAKELFYDWAGANVWFFRQIHALSGKNEIYDSLMQLISKFGETRTMFFPYIGLLCACAVVRFIIGKSRGQAGLRYIMTEWFAIITLFACTFPVNVAVNHALKDHFAYPRPYAALGSGVSKLEEREAADNNRSFPSGHVALISCLIFCLWPKLSERSRMAGTVAILAMGWSRIALGMHFPADVFWSIFITMAVVAIMRILVYGILAKIFRLKW